MEFREGEVHCLIGENGAGKSTLIKAIAGYHAPTSGTITVHGKEYSEMTVPLAAECGIQVIYQEFNNVPPLTAAENVFLGVRTNPGLFVDFEGRRKAAMVTPCAFRSRMILNKSFTSSTVSGAVGSSMIRIVRVLAHGILRSPRSASWAGLDTSPRSDSGSSLNRPRRVEPTLPWAGPFPGPVPTEKLPNEPRVPG